MIFIYVFIIYFLEVINTITVKTFVMSQKYFYFK